MERLYKFTLIFLISLYGCSHGATSEHVHSSQHQIDEIPESDGHHHHEGEIILHDHIAKEFGVTVGAVTPSSFHAVIKVGGRILPATSDDIVISAKSSGIVSFRDAINPGYRVSRGNIIASLSASGIAGGDINEATALAVEAAKNELDRLKPLYDEQIISKKEYITARNNYEQALASHSGSQSGSSVISPTDGVIAEIYVKPGEYVESGQPIVRISSARKLLLRADVPERKLSSIKGLQTANIRMPYSDAIISLSERNGQIVSDATVNIPAVAGYVPVYFEFSNDGSVTPGSGCEVYLMGDEISDAIVIPESSIIEQMGQKYVFIKDDKECYRKVHIEVGESDGINRNVLSGVNPGDSIVLTGVAFMKLSENKNLVPPGHTHNH